jgi:hypothetical protein
MKCKTPIYYLFAKAEQILLLKDYLNRARQLLIKKYLNRTKADIETQFYLQREIKRNRLVLGPC